MAGTGTRYPVKPERVFLAGLEEPRVARARACSSTVGKFKWLKFNICVNRREGPELPPLSAPAAVNDLVHDVFPEMAPAAQERMIAFGCDTHNVPVGAWLVSLGTLNATMVGPADVLRPLLLLPASGLIIAHNHPSGDPKPSDADIKMTEQLMQGCKLIGAQLLDHVIVTRNRSVFVSMRTVGYIR